LRIAFKKAAEPDLETETDDIAADTKPAKPTKPSDGIWAPVGIATAVTLAGVFCAFLILWSMLVEKGNSQHQQNQALAIHSGLEGFFNSRITNLRRDMEVLAASPAIAEAIQAYSGTADNTGLAGSISYSLRVDAIPFGRGRVDQHETIPLSYAALDVIKRAEKGVFVGPELSLSQRQQVYAAQPITRGEEQIGVLFVIFSADYFYEPLNEFGGLNGQIRVIQAFPDSQPIEVITYGAPGQADLAQQGPLDAQHWSLTYEPASLGDIITVREVLIALSVASVITFGGVVLGFKLYARRARNDLVVLANQIRAFLSRQPTLSAYFTLPMIEQEAERILEMCREIPAVTANRKRVADADPDSDVADALLGDEPVAAEDLELDDDSDFLDVSPSSVVKGELGIEVNEDTTPIETGLNLDDEIFRAYDIRGVTATNLTPDVVYWIGRALAAEVLDAGEATMAIGRDGRLSSEGLSKELARGLNEGGVDVVDAGQVPTPVLYFATHTLNTTSGVMITGSHNPPEYNGLKIVIAGTTLAEDRIQALKTRILENDLSSGDGSVSRANVAEAYIERVLEDVVVAQPLKIVVDCGNGVAGGMVPELLTELGCEVVPLYCDVDGNFPNHHPDPADPKNLEDLITVVGDEGADLGLAFDGDGDRLGVVTSSGQVIWPDKLLMLFAQDIVGRNPGADVIYDVKCSRHLSTLIAEYGGRPIMWKTGHSHIKAKLKETGALLAGEFSGHICFGERWYGFDDALYSAARLVEIIAAEGMTTDELFEQFPTSSSTPELKVATTDAAKFSIMESLTTAADFGDGTITDIDGLRVDYADGWGLIRASNTSPMLTLRFEAEDDAALERIQDVFSEQLANIDPELKFR
jgi:phosphomannomutase/phosphoglucomutase